MCLAIPGQLVEMVDPTNHIAKVDIGGVRRNVNVGLLATAPEGVAVGDWLLIHVGFAISKVDEDEAATTLRMLRGLGQAFDDEIAQLKGSNIA